MRRLLLSVFWGRGASGKGSALRTAAAVIAGAVGVFAISLSAQLASDLRTAFATGAQGLPDREYIVISKKVDLGMALSEGRSAFSAEEMAAVEEAPGVLSVDPVVSNAFAAALSLRFGGVELGTEIFYESVPDDFLGSPPTGWGWKEGDQVIPIIVSRDFLALYNMGFAASRGLPAVPEAALGMVTARSVVSGTGGTLESKARIVGLTDRISSILVPRSFMTWANTTIAQRGSPPARRLIVQTAPSRSGGLEGMLKDRGWERAQQGGAAAGVLALARAILTAAVAAGALLAGLAVALLALSLSLAVERSRESIRVARLLGYPRATLALALAGGSTIGIAAVSAVAAACAVCVDHAFRAFIGQAAGTGLSGIPAAALVAAACLAVVLAGVFPLAGLRLIARLDRE